MLTLRQMLQLLLPEKHLIKLQLDIMLLQLQLVSKVRYLRRTR